MSQKDTLLHGSVTKSLLTFTIPIFLALVLQTMYATVDMLIVSRFGTVSDVSAVSTGAQLMNIVISLCSGLASGATVLIGQYIGQQAKEKVGTVIGNSLVLFTLFSIVLAVVAVICHQPLVFLLNTPAEAINETAAYIFYSSIGIPMVFAYNIISSIFRGIGNAKVALLTIGISCIINIILDFVFVWGLQMGAGGAAIATVISQTISVIISFLIMLKIPMLKLKKQCFRLQLDCLKRILNLGIPIAFQGVLVSISFLAIIVIVNQFGLIFSAAVGVVGRIVGFIMLVPSAFGQSVSVFASQNYGAGQHTRAKQGLKFSIGISLAVSVVMAYVAFFHGDFLIRIFDDDATILQPARDYLNAFAIETLLVPLLFCLSGFLTGYGKTMFTMVQSIIGAIALRLLFVYLFSLITPPSLFFIGLATPIATFIQIVLCYLYYLHYFSKHKLKDT